MADSPDDSTGEYGKAESSGHDAAGPNGANPQPRAVDHLPVVWSPHLNAEAAGPRNIEAADGLPNFDTAETMSPSEDESAGEAADETTGDAADAEAAAAPGRHISRFPLLAATIALAAAVGSFAGVLAGSGILRLAPLAPRTAVADTGSVLQGMRSQLAELAAIKSNLDGATRSANTQFAKITDRLDRVERAQADPAAKLAQIADMVDRLSKRAAAAPDITGSIPSKIPADAATVAPKPTDAILDNWIVQDVHNGRALVASRYGSMFVVGAGSMVPGLGRVEAVERQDGQWVVVTAHGLITSGR